MSSSKENYQKYKYRVKVWEKNFKKIHGRVPSKHDIREAPKEIRESYKMYYKLKTSFLEDTLNDVLSEDGFDILDSSQNDINLMTVSSTDLPKGVAELVDNDTGANMNLFSNLEDLSGEQKLSTTNKMNLNDDHVIKEFEPVEELEINKNAWVDNNNLNKTHKTKSPKKEVFKSNLSAKLFSTTSFMKRNPRKSLSRSISSTLSQSGNKQEVHDKNGANNQCALPDFETILTQKSQQKSQENIIALAPKVPKQITTDVDKKWLDRCQLEGTVNLDTSLKSRTLSPENEKTKKFGISNINLESSYLLTPTNSKESNIISSKYEDSDSVVSNSEDERSPRAIRHAAKKRRILKDVNTNKVPQTDELKLLPTSENAVNNDETEIPNKNKADNLEKTVNKEIMHGDTSRVSKKEHGKEVRQSKTRIRKSIRNKKDIFYCETSSDVDQKGNPDEIEQKSGNTSIKNRGRRRKRTSTVDSESAELDESNNAEYPLYLEVGNLKSLPRANIDELTQAQTVVDKFVESIKTDTSTDITSENSKNNLERKKLEAKVATGKLNENFVRLNMKKKVFAKGKKVFNYGRYKKVLWKRKKEAALCGPEMDMRGCDGGILTCFKCGEPGHFERQCKIKGDNLLPLDAELEDESPFPTLEQAERMAEHQALQVHSKNIDNMPKISNTLLYKDNDFSKSKEIMDKDIANSDIETLEKVDIQPKQLYIGHKIPEDFLKKSGLLEDVTKREIEPLYKLNPDGSPIDVTSEVTEVLRMFGHQSFRKGQDKAVMRILCGLSTLVTLSTGSGKSLCYQLPAYLFSRKRKAITLVISPLVSLMEDQVHGVPIFIRAHCLHTNQTPQQRLKVLELISRGEVDVLLLSPEAVVAGERSTGFGALLKNLPPIAFACIDEAHCVSQWSHNFRPSYLMICKVLRQKLGVRTILGLTATATLTTQDSIVRHLNIPDGLSGIISDTPLPDNLILSVSTDSNRDAALIKLLRSERFDPCQSIIVYCTRRDECERIARYIRTCLQDKKPEETSGRKRKRVNWNAEAYHAGMPASRRRTVQKAFMENQLRIVVATIAFGMGINKSDIRAIIHYNTPRNFESYVQEVGRAGRDGMISHCHLFLDSKGTDQSELRRHIYANSIDRHVIRKLLQKVFIPCACEKNLGNLNFIKEHSEEIKAIQDINWDVDFYEDSTKHIKKERKCPGHEIGFSIETTVQTLDIPEENISTLLCYLELEGRWAVNVLSNAYIMAKVISYGGFQCLKKAAKTCPPLAMAIALEIKKGTFDSKNNILEFSVIEISSAIGWNSGVVKQQLKNLEWTTGSDGLPKRSAISVNYYDLGFRLRSPGDFTDEELDEALDNLHDRAVQQEKTQLVQLQYVSEGLSSVAYKTCIPCCDKNFPLERSNKLKEFIRDYFQSDFHKNIDIKYEDDNTPDEQIVNNVRSMISMYPENNFTGRALAKIFYGITSPNYPAVIWSKCKYWRAHTRCDFNRLVRLSNLAIVQIRT